MFHYSLITHNNQARVLIAILMAVAAHIVLMIFTFRTETLYVPEVSLPRSVSVFLDQNSTPKTTGKKKPKASQSVVNQARIKANPQRAVLPEPAVLPKIQSNSLQSAMKAEKTEKPEPVKSVKDPTIEKNFSTYIPTEKTSHKVQNNELLNKNKITRQAGSAAHAGIMQMAYPRYQLNNPPSYPGLARKRGQEGTVILQVLVNRKGRVEDLKIENSSNYSLLDRAAVTTVQNWLFEPGRKGNEQISMWVRVPVTFKLK